MPDPSQLPYLVRLLDDETPEVRAIVLGELGAFGHQLEDEMVRLGIELTPRQQELVQELLDRHGRDWLQSVWPTWLDVEDETTQLESALGMLAEYLSGRTHPVKLNNLLDRLADEFTAGRFPVNPRELSSFLFVRQRLQGARNDYYNPQNSNLLSVIERKQGIPISLACVYILVGARLGIPVRGCNFPGHFFALVREGPATSVVDCFDGGKFLESADLEKYTKPVHVTVEEISRLECSTSVIIARVLRNLINAYQMTLQRAADAANRDRDRESLLLMVDLLDVLEKWQGGRRHSTT